jgi:hypothetical protein
MNHAAAKSAVDELFIGRGRRLPQLRAHLEGCVECRAHYDHTAHAFRALTGKPDEMTAEELSLFAPIFPDQVPVRARWPLVWLGGLAAAAAALVLFVQPPPPSPSEFNARGGTPSVHRSSARALCSHGDESAPEITDAVEGKCLAGDRLLLVAAAKGQRYVAVALVDGNGRIEPVVSGADGALTGEREAVLPNGSIWRPGLRALAIFGDAPIAPAVVEQCARGDCPSALERREIPLERSGP